MSYPLDAKCRGQAVEQYVLDEPRTAHHCHEDDRDARAAKLCAGCPVIPECAARALITRDSGIVRAGLWLGSRAAPTKRTTAQLVELAQLVPV